MMSNRDYYDDRCIYHQVGGRCSHGALEGYCIEGPCGYELRGGDAQCHYLNQESGECEFFSSIDSSVYCMRPGACPYNKYNKIMNCCHCAHYHTYSDIPPHVGFCEYYGNETVAHAGCGQFERENYD